MKLNHPDRLLKLYIAISTIALVTILALLFSMIRDVFESHDTRNAQRDAVSIGYLLYQLEKKTLIDPTTGLLRKTVRPEDFLKFDLRMRSFLGPMDIVKIKIFGTDERIMYSTEHKIIGQLDENNLSLIKALKGEVSSELEHKDTVADLEEEKRFNVDVVETYLPILNDAGKIMGALEIYLDITPNRIEVSRTIKTSLIIIGTLLFIVFTILFLLMAIGTKQLSVVQGNLSNMANKDGLTNLYNRRYIDTFISQEYSNLQAAAANKETYNVGLIMVDLDHFKQINDQYGHLVGDGILVGLADRLKTQVRDQDVIGRYGGEEFLVILANAGLEDTIASAERIWKAIKGQPLDVSGEQYPVTASIGVTNIVASDKTPWIALDRADEALYKAKEQGRNQVVVNHGS